MSKKAWIIFVAAVVLFLGGLVAMSNSKKVDVSNVNAASIQPATEQSGNIADHVLGNKESKVILVEYGDFQCPGCKAVHPTVKALAEKYEDQIAFVFRNFPLTTIHANARTAAAAAEAAGLQGKYWEMHDQLYETQDSWKSLSPEERGDFFANYAKELNLNVEQFKTDLASEAIAEKINFDLALGRKVGVSGTPGLFLNGNELTQPTWSDPTKFEAAIEAELKKNNIDLPKTDEK